MAVLVAATAQRHGWMGHPVSQDISNIDTARRYRCVATGARGRMGWSQGATVTLRAVVCVPGNVIRELLSRCETRDALQLSAVVYRAEPEIVLRLAVWEDGFVESRVEESRWSGRPIDVDGQGRGPALKSAWSRCGGSFALAVGAVCTWAGRMSVRGSAGEEAVGSIRSNKAHFQGKDGRKYSGNQTTATIKCDRTGRVYQSGSRGATAPARHRHMLM